MDRHETLLDLERAAWRALSSDGDAAAEFYREVLADDVLTPRNGTVSSTRLCSTARASEATPDGSSRSTSRHPSDRAARFTPRGLGPVGRVFVFR